ncbi:MAG: hypothetical protein ACSHXD_18755 [Marinosulfonomonas sp.]
MGTPTNESPVLEIGAGPFVTLRQYGVAEGLSIWRARHHRKGIGAQAVAAGFWQSRRVNALMGTLFAIGSLFFVIGAALSLWPGVAQSAGLSVSQVNILFFVGSAFFTTAAYLQLVQAANAPPHPGQPPATRGFKWFGWRPYDPGWIASVAQFAGTLLFNVNTYDGLNGGGSWLSQDFRIWVPDFVGSILFLISGYLVWIETCHKWFAWLPQELDWWIVAVNFLGCVFFMISACLAFVPPGGIGAGALALSTELLLAGAVCFFIGALLLVVEAATKAPSQAVAGLGR